MCLSTVRCLAKDAFSHGKLQIPLNRPFSHMSENRFTKFELKSIMVLSSVLVMRMIGLFMILPVLALYTHEVSGATPYLIGIALGIYGLTQAIFQVPMGAASDRWGRKPLLLLGLSIFVIGSVVAAESTSIFGIILGRALQGVGTIAAVVLAMVGDIVRESQRPKSMAIVGVSIGSAFTLSLMLGPLFDQWIGIQGLFWAAAGLGLLGMVMVLTAVPKPDEFADVAESESVISTDGTRLLDPQLIVLFSGTMVLHMMMTSLFLAFPIEFSQISGFTRHDMWKVFVPVLLASFAVMMPLIRFSAKSNRSNDVMILAGFILVVAQLVLYLNSSDGSVALLVVGLWLFFVGFNALEALFPSTTVSRAPAHRRGTVMGIFNACTFIGAFFGGVFGGLIYTRHEATGVFLFCGIAILIWIAIAAIIRRIWA